MLKNNHLKPFKGGAEIFFLVFMTACTPMVTKKYCTYQDVQKMERPSIVDKAKGQCHEYLNYAPDTNHLEFTPIKYVRVNFHFMNSADGKNNLSEKDGIEWAKLCLYGANYMFENNKKSLLPAGNSIPVLPVRIQYVLTPRPGDPWDDGIYFHYDDDLYFMVKEGKNSTLYDKSAFEKYGVMKDTVLNIFLMPHHPDSVESKSYGAHKMGIALGSHLKLVWHFHQNADLDAKQMRGTFNHEVGHIYSLVHAWAYNDGCDDTPMHSLDERSNNMMDYNSNQLALTPCQIGKMHWRMSTPGSQGRKFLMPIWCQRDTTKNITIRDSVNWLAQKDLEGDLIIASGAILRIGCRVSVPAEGKIVVEPGAKLILDDCKIHNDCGDQWLGIEIQEQKNEKGQVLFWGNPKLNDMVHSLDFSEEVPKDPKSP